MTNSCPKLGQKTVFAQQKRIAELDAKKHEKVRRFHKVLTRNSSCLTGMVPSYEPTCAGSLRMAEAKTVHSGSRTNAMQRGTMIGLQVPAAAIVYNRKMLWIQGGDGEVIAGFQLSESAYADANDFSALHHH
jgi:hypothetical protein